MPPLQNVEDMLHERGINICQETVGLWWNRFGPMFASEIRRCRAEGIRSSRWRWHLDEVFVKINGKRYYCPAPSVRRLSRRTEGISRPPKIKRQCRDTARISMRRTSEPGHYLWRADDHEGKVLEPIGNIPPAEAEKRYYATLDEQSLAA